MGGPDQISDNPKGMTDTPNTNSPQHEDGHADLVSSQDGRHDSPTTKQPLIIEICAGSAMLSRCFKERGFAVLPIDHKANRFTPLAEICTLDLTKEHSWTFLHYVLKHYPVKFIHAAPPCGTSSRAREIKLRGHCPQPLRTEAEPHGIDTLSGEELERVQAANFIYQHMSELLISASKMNVSWTVENPARSLMWNTQWLQELASFGQFYNFAACAWGSSRPTDKSFLSNQPAFSALQAECPGNHEHEPYGRKRDASGQVIYGTSEEAAYPKQLCAKIVDIVQKALNLFPSASQASHATVSFNAAASTSTHKQPRGRKMPPILSEFVAVTTIQVSEKPPLDSKHCLTSAWHGVPQFSKLLQCDESGENESRRYNCTFGVFRSPLQWITDSLLLEHPFDVFHAVPDNLIIALFNNLTWGPAAVVEHRAQVLRKWLRRAKELEGDEIQLKNNMDPGVRSVLDRKRVLLLKEIAISLKWPDLEFFDELTEGFKLVGLQQPSGVFPLEPRPMAYSVDEFDGAAKFLRPALLGKVNASALDDDAQKLWDLTLEEAKNSHWLLGPKTPGEVTADHPGGWIPVRRFGVWQSSGDKAKLRPIDDFAENRINGAFGYSDKLDLRTLDQMIWLCCAFARAIHDGVVRLRLSDGRILDGALHSSYGADGALPRLSVLDLSNAYKQLPLHPTNRRYSLITLKDPKSGKAACFEGRVLPFGATASVVHFNRCSRLIQRIGIHLNLLMTNYFDDYPVLAPCALCDSSMSTMTMLLQLLGFDYAEHKLKPFDTCASVLLVEVDVSALPDGDVAVKNKLSRVQEVSNLIDSTISAGELSFKDASKLLGRVQYADSFVMGRDGRLAMHDIREHIKGGDKRGSLSVESCASLGLLKSRLLQGAPRTVPWRVDSNPALIFIDGASEADAHTIGGVLLIDGCVEYFAANVPPELVDKWQKSSKHIIGMVKLYAVAVARKTWEHRLASRKTISFVDNDAAKESLVRGTSGSRHFREILLAIERVESENRSWVWTARVPSHSNPADEPSRGVFDGILKRLCAERINAFCPMMRRSLPHL